MNDRLCPRCLATTAPGAARCPGCGEARPSVPAEVLGSAAGLAPRGTTPPSGPRRTLLGDASSWAAAAGAARPVAARAPSPLSGPGEVAGPGLRAALAPAPSVESWTAIAADEVHPWSIGPLARQLPTPPPVTDLPPASDLPPAAPATVAAPEVGVAAWSIRESPRAAALRDAQERAAAGLPPPHRAAGAGVLDQPWAGTLAPTPRRRPRRRRLRAGLRAVALLAVASALAVGGAFATHRITLPSSHGIALPMAIDGQPRVSGVAELDRAAADTHQAAVSQPGVQQAIDGYFGSAADGRLLFLLALRGNHDGLDVNQFIDGFTRTSGTRVDHGSLTSHSAGGAEYSCFRATSVKGVGGSVCVWSDVDVVGSVIDFGTPDLAAALDATEKARAATEV